MAFGNRLKGKEKAREQAVFAPSNGSEYPETFSLPVDKVRPNEAKNDGFFPTSHAYIFISPPEDITSICIAPGF